MNWLIPGSPAKVMKKLEKNFVAGGGADPKKPSKMHSYYHPFTPS
jgi:hypothetical protein